MNETIVPDPEAIVEASQEFDVPRRNSASDLFNGAGGGQASFAVRCASRTELSAITVSAPRPSGPLAGALPAGVEPIVKRADLLVFTAEGVGYAVRLRAEDVQVTAARGCQ